MDRRRLIPLWPVALLLLGGVVAAFAPPPKSPSLASRHEDPAASPPEADPGALLRFYAAGLSHLSTWRVDETKRLLLHLDPASLPPELQHYASNLKGLMLAESDQIQAINQLLHDAAVQARAGQTPSARRILDRLRRHVERATALLAYALQDVQAFVGTTPRAPGGRPADPATREAYRELVRLAARARALLAAYAAATRGPQSAQALTRLLPYPTEVTLSAPAVVYPGRAFVVSGTARELAPVPSHGRRLLLRLDGRAVADLPPGPFRRTVVLPRDTLPGSYVLEAEAPAQGRYLVGLARARIDVQQSRTVIRVTGALVTFAPGHATVSGTIRSGFGPVASASVLAWTGDVSARAQTSPDGGFRVTLDFPGWLQALGPQDLRIRVVPREPWNAPSETSLRLLVLNLPGLALGLVGACVAVLWAARERRARTPRAPGAPWVSSPEFGDREPPAAPAAPALLPNRGAVDPNSPLGRLLRAYGEALRRVQELTGASLPPSATLREFAQRAGERLGETVFLRMTALAERAIYAGQAVECEWADRMEHLNARLHAEVGRDRP